jgi:hypothetical protein
VGELNGGVTYRFSDVSMTIIDREILQVILRNVDDGVRVLTFRLVLSLTWFGETEYGIRPIKKGMSS